jgi:hypothetical protein
MKAQREQRRRHGARAVDPEDHAWRDLLKARPRAAAERALYLMLLRALAEIVAGQSTESWSVAGLLVFARQCRALRELLARREAKVC